jgi:hypothetical protein
LKLAFEINKGKRNARNAGSGFAWQGDPGTQVAPFETIGAGAGLFALVCCAAATVESVHTTIRTVTATRMVVGSSAS